MRRRIALSVLLLLLAAVTIPATPGAAQTSQPMAAQQPGGVRADFNQDGFADLAAGARDEMALGLTEAGAVSVLDGSSGGLTATGGRLFIQVTPEVQTSGLFGFALATGDVNGDGAADLAVGAAGHNEFAGAVSVLYGSAAGVTTTGGQLFTQNSPGVPGASEPYDYFGASLAAASLQATSTAASPTGTSSTARPAQPSR